MMPGEPTAFRRAAIATALLLLSSTAATAFECILKPPVCQAAWRDGAVFTALVTSSWITDPATDGSPRAMIRARLTVLEPFVNMTRRELSLESPMSPEIYMFRAGEQYLVFANESDGALVVSACSRTRRLADAKEDLEYLRSLSTKAPVSRVFGRITERSRHPAEPQDVEYGPMANVRVSISGDGFARDVMTDDDGRYEVTNVPVGKVDIKVDVPFSVSPREGDWQIRDRRGCIAADFVVSPVATATGRVVDADGKPIGGVAVDAVAAELAGHVPNEMHPRAISDAHGIFTFDDLPPGDYVFGLHLTKRAPNASDAAPLYIPGPDRARAAVVTLAPGDRRDVGTLRLKTP